MCKFSCHSGFRPSKSIWHVCMSETFFPFPASQQSPSAKRDVCVSWTHPNYGITPSKEMSQHCGTQKFCLDLRISDNKRFCKQAGEISRKDFVRQGWNINQAVHALEIQHRLKPWPEKRTMKYGAGGGGWDKNFTEEWTWELAVLECNWNRDSWEPNKHHNFCRAWKTSSPSRTSHNSLETPKNRCEVLTTLPCHYQAERRKRKPYYHIHFISQSPLRLFFWLTALFATLTVEKKRKVTMLMCSERCLCRCRCPALDNCTASLFSGGNFCSARHKRFGSRTGISNWRRFYKGYFMWYTFTLRFHLLTKGYSNVAGAQISKF